MKYLKTITKIKFSRSWLHFILSIYLKLIIKSYTNKPEDYKNKIFVFWHSKMLIGWWLFRDQDSLALVSLSSDGEILSNLLVKWQYEVIRGSSSKGGKEAIKELIKASINGKPVVITPDGPRGPAKEFKNGPLILSIEKGYDIIPVNIIFNKKIILQKSWDKFEIPLPLSKCKIIFGDPVKYNNFLYNEELINFKKSICEQM
jgi:lysophospholipid acyltransferase (LPLAT)-like uncharacterized protein